MMRLHDDHAGVGVHVNADVASGNAVQAPELFGVTAARILRPGLGSGHGNCL